MFRLRWIFYKQPFVKAKSMKLRTDKYINVSRNFCYEYIEILLTDLVVNETY